MRRDVKAVLAAAALCASAGAGQAQISDGVIKIGVMNDQSGLYADLSGQGSVWAARKAIDDFCKTAKCEKIEVVFADHQNKPDIGSNVVRQWYDVDKVDVVVDEREEQGVPGVGCCRVRPDGQGVQPQHHTLDL
jgi:branched-chain amino acid transport system substrate-binding protein